VKDENERPGTSRRATEALPGPASEPRAKLTENGTLEIYPDEAAACRHWADGASPLERRLLRWIVRRYAGLPFGEDEAELGFAAEEAWTGAEIRVALARMRRDGVLLAVRKTWGDRLLYVPAEKAGLWRLTLAPPRAKPLEGEPDAEPLTAVSRLPLSLELLAVWSAMRRHGFPLTAKGVPHKARTDKLASGMRLTGEEVAASGILTAREQPAPPNVALALDIGLCVGALSREPGRLAVSDRPPADWAGKSRPEVDAELLELATLRYAGREAKLHGAATALRGLKPGLWYKESEVRGSEEPGAADAEGEDDAWERWLGLMSSFGWLERAVESGSGERIVRWTIDPSLPGLRHGSPAAEAVPGEGTIYVQPDLEILVPPEAGFDARWILESVAERTAADVVFAYRLTRESCHRANEAGWTFSELAGWLERQSGGPLPESARRALADWFSRLGRASVAEATLLRLADEEAAELVARDEKASGLLEERLSERVFVVRPGGAEALVRRLGELGYPAGSFPSAGARTAGGKSAGGKAVGTKADGTKADGMKADGTKTVGTKADGTNADGTKAVGTKADGTKADRMKKDGTKTDGTRADETKADRVEAAESQAEASPERRPLPSDPGWVLRRPASSFYEEDRAPPKEEELFPGLRDVPAAWLREPRSYHVSTRRELVERAIAWRTGLKLRQENGWVRFVPEKVRPTERGWAATGWLRPDGETGPVRSPRLEWSADRFAEMMIELPAPSVPGPDGTWTNH